MEERCRRNPETLISVTMFIVNFTVCLCLIFVVVVVVFLRVTPACALTFVVYENAILSLLPNK